MNIALTQSQRRAEMTMFFVLFVKRAMLFLCAGVFCLIRISCEAVQAVVRCVVCVPMCIYLCMYICTLTFRHRVHSARGIQNAHHGPKCVHVI